MQPRVINIFELAMLAAWFAIGFVPGYLVAEAKGLFTGLMIGFFVFLVTLITYGRSRIAIERRAKKPR